MIPEYDALYDLKKQWYYEFLPFLSNQPGIDKLILGGDVAETSLEVYYLRTCTKISYTGHQIYR